jgi:hypothetical protein
MTFLFLLPPQAAQTKHLFSRFKALDERLEPAEQVF